MQAERAEWWMGEVEGIVARLIEEKADAKKQEEAWTWIKDALAPEAVPVAKQLLAEWSGKASSKTAVAGMKARPEEVKEDEEEGDGGFADEQAAADDEPPVLSKASPYDTAKEFVRRRCIKDG